MFQRNSGNGKQKVPSEMFVLSLHSFVWNTESFVFERFPDFFVELLNSIGVDSDWNLLFWQHQNNIELAFVHF